MRCLSCLINTIDGFSGTERDNVIELLTQTSDIHLMRLNMEQSRKFRGKYKRINCGCMDFAPTGFGLKLNKEKEE